jgi:hypothetical protein|tara:strand:+ start:784 stop:1062 length:279 start_codon:yes stop_codon:yes gene_type:complete
MRRVWEFEDTGEAYDAVMCDEKIKTGDILVIHDEGVVGIADTWPVAVTKARREFHKLSAFTAGKDPAEASAHILAAVGVARDLGLEVEDELS